ncbi:ABC transporter substrate-binding protein [Microbacterium sp. NC79]|uniref:ABC transporter substrate-binding protein n=1 Tax=Microbacterium sp. NC79 TaxID=2851009 RepID=UPI001C2BE6F2|nr:ABC transporter substrate-binding protein [Microbacterium sp. NC79]MBV0896158.1 hypothetical protein [Microbacterium sp. NC79]
MKKALKAIAVVGAAALLLTGCVPGTGSDGNAGGDSGATKDTLVFAQTVDPRNLDPQNALQTSADRINRNVYDRLFTRNDKSEIVPQLVTEYQQVDDTTWTMSIRDDATFHDGTALTAADVEFTLDRLKDPALLESRWYSQITEVTATGEFDIEITTDGPMPTLLAALSKSGADIMPAAYIEEHGIEEFIKSPIGSGPYKFVEWRRDDRVVLERNDDYWGGTPKWASVEVRTIPENSTRVSELLTGGVDIATDIPVVDWERVGSGETTMAFGETSRTMMLMLRVNEPHATQDVRLREAIDLAIDKQAIVDTLFNGNAVPVRTRAPHGIVFGGDPDLYNTSLYDLDRAKELVAEVVAEGGDVELHYSASRGSYPMDAELAEMVSAMLTEAGFTVNLEILEGGAFGDIYSDYSSQEVYQVALADGLLDASYALQGYATELGMPRLGYSNAKVDELLAAANRTLDSAEREDLYAQVQKIIAEEDRPQVMLYLQPSAYGVNAGLKFSPRADDGVVFDAVELTK